MSGGLLEIPAFVIGVAGVFTTCVDAFGYFKLYQNATKDIEIVLLKLDIEKARLLFWGENLGILSADRRNPQLLDERIANLVKRILGQIHELLTDSDKLTTTYGVRIPDSSFLRAVDYLSAKSQAIYQPSSDRFWVRNASRLADFTRGSRAARTKWAIHERQKFQELVNTLGNFIDNLFELIHVSREILDRVVVEDIESIIDISCLTIVEEATDNYPVYSKAAKSAKTSTEAGTLDRRTFEEHIRDRSDIELAQLRPTEDHTGSESDSCLSELQSRSRYIVITSPCRARTTDEPCDVRFLGSQVAMGSTEDKYRPKWDVSSHTRSSRNMIWSIVHHAIGIRKIITDAAEYGVLGNLLKAASDPFCVATDEQEAFIEGGLPLLTLYIYCSPCVCLIHTAITVCKKLESPYVTVQIRPDGRLVSSCCSVADRNLGMRSISDWIRTHEAKATSASTTSALAKFVDMVWLDGRLEHLDYEVPYSFKETPYGGDNFIILGEADHLNCMLQKAPGRMPRATEIWKLSPQTLQRSFIGRFIERGPMATVYPAATAAPQLAGSRRPADSSPVGSAARRPRSDTESPDAQRDTGGRGDAISEGDNTSVVEAQSNV